jgi:NADH-quinone oxidoreductase subunit M
MTLSILWLLPLIGGTLVAFMPARWSKWMSVATTVFTLGVAISMAVLFDPSAHRYQFSEELPWIPQLAIFYRLGVDGISVWLVVLNAFLSVIAVLATPVSMKNANRFLGLILAMEAGLAGVFMSVDLVLFYVFWEAMLIPAYFLLWLFGEGERPGRAAVKFVLYTLAVLRLMLVGVIFEYVVTRQQP